MTKEALVKGVELRGLEPLTPTLPVWCATSCATAPRSCPATLQAPRPAPPPAPPARRRAARGLGLPRLHVGRRRRAADRPAAQVVRTCRSADERPETGVVALQPPAQI